MKKTLIIGALVVAGSFSAYSQGTVAFLDRKTDMTIHIFAPQLANPAVEIVGNQGGGIGTTSGGVATDIYDNNGTDPGIGVSGLNYGGSTVYTGGAIGNTAAANPTPAGSYHYNNGADYTVELYAGVGASLTLAQLLPVSQYTGTIYTSGTIGGAFQNVTVSSDPGIASTGVNPTTVVTVALYAWYNGGTGMTLAQAQGALDPWGVSPLDQITALGNTTTPTGANTPPDLEGLQSFSLQVSPEPSTIALGVIGASAFLFRRRK